MSSRILIDTDVLIDYLRGQPDAVTYLEGLTEHLLISVITLAELHAGVREGDERTRLDQFVRVFQVVPVDSGIARVDYTEGIISRVTTWPSRTHSSRRPPTACMQPW